MRRRKRHDSVPLAKTVYRTVRRNAIEQPVQDAALRFAQPALRDFDEAAPAAALVDRDIRVVMQRRGTAARVDAPVIGQPVERRRAHAEPAGEIAGRRPLRHVATGERRRQRPLDRLPPHDTDHRRPTIAIPGAHERGRIGQERRKRVDLGAGPARTEARKRGIRAFMYPRLRVAEDGRHPRDDAAALGRTGEHRLGNRAGGVAQG